MWMQSQTCTEVGLGEAAGRLPGKGWGGPATSRGQAGAGGSEARPGRTSLLISEGAWRRRQLACGRPASRTATEHTLSF